MSEITFAVERYEDTGALAASWDEPAGQGGITTQASDLRELQNRVQEAVRCNFDAGENPRVVRLHFLSDALLQTAGNCRATSLLPRRLRR